MHNHERFQTFCRVCHKVFEADSAEAAIALALDHEITEHETPRTAV